MILLKFCLLGLFCISLEGVTLSNEKRLIDDLLHNYNKNVLPRKHRNAPLEVTLRIQLRRIIEMRETEQVLKTDIWLTQDWSNIFLKWNPDDYNGIKSVNIQKSEIWLPDTLILNDVGNETNKHFTDNSTYIYLHHNGKHQTYFPLIVMTACQLDIASFPFDEQECSIKFSTWTNDQTRIRLSHPTSFTKGEYTESPAWTLVEGTIYNTSTKYACCTDRFSGVTMDIKLRRNSLFYGIILLFPITMAWIPVLLGFVAPTATGERISFSISVLLTLVFYIEVANKSLPRSSNHIPLFGQYYAGVVVIIVSSTLFTAIATKVFHSRNYKLVADFNRFEKALLSFGSYLPYIGPKCKRVVELKKQNLTTKENRTWSIKSEGTSETAFQREERGNTTQDPMRIEEERLDRFVNHVQQISLDEGFDEETNEAPNHTKSILRRRTDKTVQHATENKASDSNCKNLHVTAYRMKLQRLQSISKYLGAMVASVRKKKSRDIEQSKQAQYASAIVDLIDRITLSTFALVLMLWFMFTIGTNIIKTNEHKHEH